MAAVGRRGPGPGRRGPGGRLHPRVVCGSACRRRRRRTDPPSRTGGKAEWRDARRNAGVWRRGTRARRVFQSRVHAASVRVDENPRHRRAFLGRRRVGRWRSSDRARSGSGRGSGRRGHARRRGRVERGRGARGVGNSSGVARERRDPRVGGECDGDRNRRHRGRARAAAAAAARFRASSRAGEKRASLGFGDASPGTSGTALLRAAAAAPWVSFASGPAHMLSSWVLVTTRRVPLAGGVPRASLCGRRRRGERVWQQLVLIFPKKTRVRTRVRVRIGRDVSSWFARTRVVRRNRKHVAPRGDFARSRASPAPFSSSSRCSSSRLGTREKSDAPPLSAPRPLLSHPPALRREFPERLDGHQPRVLLRRLHGVRGGTHRRGFRGVSLKLRDERGGARAAAVSPPVSPPFLESAPVTAAATREACSSQTATSAASEGMRPRRYL